MLWIGSTRKRKGLRGDRDLVLGSEENPGTFRRFQLPQLSSSTWSQQLLQRKLPQSNCSSPSIPLSAFSLSLSLFPLFHSPSLFFLPLSYRLSPPFPVPSYLSPPLPASLFLREGCCSDAASESLLSGGSICSPPSAPRLYFGGAGGVWG